MLQVKIINSIKGINYFLVYYDGAIRSLNDAMSDNQIAAATGWSTIVTDQMWVLFEKCLFSNKLEYIRM